MSASCIYETKWRAPALACSLILLLALLSCTQENAGPTSETPFGETPHATFSGIASDPTAGAAANLAIAASSTVTPPGDGVTWISAEPGTLADASSSDVTLLNVRTLVSVGAQIVGGGFDPVALSASAGDSVEIAYKSSGGAMRVSRTVVPERRRPRVVRVSPSAGSTDVALNASIVIVFSEPLAPGVLDTSHIELISGGNTIAATVTRTPGSLVSVDVSPVDLLSSATTYDVVLGTGIVDLDGDSLEGSTTFAFRTTAVSTPTTPEPLPSTGPHFALSPIDDLAAGDDIGPALTVRLLDGNGQAFDDGINRAVRLVLHGPTGAVLWGKMLVVMRNGVAAVPGLWVDTEGTGMTLEAIGDYPSAVSNPFNVGPAAPSAGGTLGITEFEIVEYQYPSLPGHLFYAPQLRLSAPSGQERLAVFRVEIGLPDLDAGPTFTFCTTWETVDPGSERQLFREIYGDYPLSFDWPDGRAWGEVTAQARVLYRNAAGVVSTAIVDGHVVPGSLPTTYTGDFGAWLGRCF